MLDCQERDGADKIAMVPESPSHLENSAPRLAVHHQNERLERSGVLAQAFTLVKSEQRDGAAVVFQQDAAYD